jgi:hypothetical protein
VRGRQGDIKIVQDSARVFAATLRVSLRHLREHEDCVEDEALHVVENAQLNIESMTLQAASFSIDDTLQQIDRDSRVSTPSA